MSSFLFPLFAISCLAITLLGSGCVAFNVGKTKEFTHTERHEEMASEPSITKVVSAEAQLQAQGAEAIVGLRVDVKEEFEKRTWDETVTVRQRKRLGVGFFPGAAEFLLMPRGALQAATFDKITGASGSPSHHVYVGDPANQGGKYVGIEFCSLPLLVGTFQVVGTICSLPPLAFSSPWTCGGHDFYDPTHVRRVTGRDGKTCFDTSGSPKLRSLLKFTQKERDQIGVNTCFYSINAEAPGVPVLTHMGLVGFHKYLAVFVDDPVCGAKTTCGMETKRRNAFTTGPFLAELSIPVLGYNERRRVSSSESWASFSLPAVARDSTVEAIVSFREDDIANGYPATGITRQAIDMAAGRQWRFDIILKATGRNVSVLSKQTVTPKSGKLPYQIGGIKRDADGKYVVRVEILDQSKTFSINHLVRPDIQRMIQEDFAERNPSISSRDIRHVIQYETGNDGTALIYTGWAFSVRPTEDGWHYDPSTRRGWVRLSITGEIAADAAKQWAFDNIAAIVADKNIVMEAGKAPPSGAQYRSLGESFENDVLMVEFEAVQ